MTPEATDPAERLQMAMALRAEQRMEEALDVIAGAAAASPGDAALALANARMHYETWRPAAALFDRAARLAPGDPNPIAGQATALAEEGHAAAADTLLSRALATRPRWVAGQQQLARLRRIAGVTDGFDRNFAEGCAAAPDDLPLRLAWFQTLVVARDWRAARRVVAEGIDRMGPRRAFDLARVFLASESDEASRDPHLFDAVADVQDVGLDLARTRFHLRNGDPQAASAVAMRHVGGPAARSFWPYLSIAWRLLGDPRARWLDDDAAFVSTIDLGFATADLRTIASRLRTLLTASAPYPEQSVRGGVQTGRNLFFNPDATIQAVRRRVSAAIGDYRRRLPPIDPHHPMAQSAARPILYDGSWAVLLDPHGHHAAHTHHRGIVSSALHIALPEPDPAADPRAGWLAFGLPPAELGLDLPATRIVEPKEGRLVLFPSTTWHQTVPFASGQRLSIAFDVAVPSGL